MVQIRKYESSMKCMKSYFLGLEKFANHLKKRKMTKKKMIRKSPKTHFFVCCSLNHFKYI